MLTDEQLEKINSNAVKAAARYKKRCWWASIDDMRQEATVAQLAAAKRYDPTKGRHGNIEFGAYTWGIAVRAIRRMLLKSSAPVTAHHRLNVLKGIVHTPLTITNHQGEERERPELKAQDAPSDEIAQRAQISRQVHARMIKLVGADSVDFALGVLTGEFKPRDIAEYHRVDPKSVYRSARAIKRAIEEDRQLWKLWRDLE